MQVSRLWRRIILSAPRLWTCIDGAADPSDINAFLRLSKSAPLEITFWNDNIRLFNQYTEIIAPHAHRFHTLKTKWNRTQPGVNLLHLTMPYLQVMDIEGDNTSSPYLSLPTTPALQELTVSQFPLKWELVRIPTLRHLTLTYMKSPSTDEFVNLLRSGPSLERLEIRRWSRGDDEVDGREPESHFAPIHIPQLGVLKAEDVPPRITRVLMAYVATEGYEHLQLKPALPSCLGACYPAFGSLVENHGVIYVKMGGDDGDVITVSAGGSESSRDLYLTVRTNYSQRTGDLQGVLDAFSRASPTTLVKLQLGAFDPDAARDGYETGYYGSGPDVELTSAVLDSCPGLAVLRVGQRVDTDSALAYLAKPQMDESGVWGWPCPHLSELWMREWVGAEEDFCRTAKTRWEVPGTLPELPGLARKKLRLFQPPEWIYDDDDPSPLKIKRIMGDICEAVGGADCKCAFYLKIEHAWFLTKPYDRCTLRLTRSSKSLLTTENAVALP